MRTARVAEPRRSSKPTRNAPSCSYYLLSRGVKLYYSTLKGLKGDLAEQQVG